MAGYVYFLYSIQITINNMTVGMDKKDAEDPSHSAKKIYQWVDLEKYKDFIKYMIELDQAKKYVCFSSLCSNIYLFFYFREPNVDQSVADKKFDKL